VRRTPGLTLKSSPSYGTFWFVFTDQWDPKSIWADRRVRLAFNHAIDREGINKALTLGFSHVTGSIVPKDFEFAWPTPPHAYDPPRRSSSSRRPGIRRESMPARSRPISPSPRAARPA